MNYKPKTRGEIEQAAREAGPWTTRDEEDARFLRELSAKMALTDRETDALRVLRQREITESIQRRSARRGD